MRTLLLIGLAFGAVALFTKKRSPAPAIPPLLAREPAGGTDPAKSPVLPQLPANFWN